MLHVACFAWLPTLARARYGELISSAAFGSCSALVCLSLNRDAGLLDSSSSTPMCSKSRGRKRGNMVVFAFVLPESLVSTLPSVNPSS